jgi:hypothetical protein
MVHMGADGTDAVGGENVEHLLRELEGVRRSRKE